MNLLLNKKDRMHAAVPAYIQRSAVFDVKNA